MVKVAVFDLESDGLDHWGRDRDAFFRIGGAQVNGGPVDIFDNRLTFREQLKSADVLVGHNIINFDLPVMGLDGLKLTRERKVVDTWVTSPLQDPAPWDYVDYEGHKRVIANEPDRMKPFYKLENLAHRYGFTGKVGDLKALAKKHGGFGKIPTDDTEYRDYLTGDVHAARHLAEVQVPGMDEYAWREMRVAAVGAQMSSNGFRLDSELATAVVEAHAERNGKTLARLAEQYGVSLTDAKGAPRKKPLAGKDGKAALEAAFRQLLGTRTVEVPVGSDGMGWPADVQLKLEPIFDAVWPRTPGGAWAWGGKEILAAAAEHGNDEAQALARDVAEIGGTRTVFKTALDNVHPDGFCHPSVTFLQRTGRSSIQDPGLTVFGKHNGRHLERGIFLPDVIEGEADYWDTHVLFAVDLAQMDARAVAACSQDHAYLDMFAPGKDSHTEGALMIWGDPGRRQDFKKCGHGWNYGMSVRKLAREAGVSLEVAEHFDRTMRRRFPRLCAWKDEVRDHGERHGWVSNGFGRRVKIDSNRAYTQAPAGVGQGATRDVLLEGALRIDALDSRVIKMLKAMVHDEFVFSVRRRDALEVRDLVVRQMSGEWAPPGCSRPVPVVADASPFADRWSGCYEKAAV